MKVELDLTEDIKRIVVEAIHEIRDQGVLLDDQLAFSEPKAAEKLGLNPWQLADERRRGRIGFSRIVGGQIRYTTRDLTNYLHRVRQEAVDDERRSVRSRA